MMLPFRRVWATGLSVVSLLAGVCAEAVRPQAAYSAETIRLTLGAP